MKTDLLRCMDCHCSLSHTIVIPFHYLQPSLHLLVVTFNKSMPLALYLTLSTEFYNLSNSRITPTTYEFEATRCTYHAVSLDSLRLHSMTYRCLSAGKPLNLQYSPFHFFRLQIWFASRSIISNEPKAHRLRQSPTTRYSNQYLLIGRSSLSFISSYHSPIYRNTFLSCL